MRHLLTLHDYTTEEIRSILDLGHELKRKIREGDRPSLMQGHVAGLLFQKPSLRTRVSFESLVSQLGGQSLFLGADVGWGKREPVQDFMPILTSYLDILIIRAKRHDDVAEAMKYSQCPVINGLTDVSHPCQALADILTVEELSADLASTKIAYVGDANNVAYSLAVICAKLNVPMTIASPDGYQFEQAFIKDLNAAAGKDLIHQTDNPHAAVENAEFIYTDVWTSMGQEAENEQRLKDFADYQVNSNLMSSAKPNARLLHCLPARRGEEVSTDVIDSPASAVVQQAENRLHAQKGLVVWMLQNNRK